MAWMALGLAMIVRGAEATEPWLLPERFTATPGATLQFHFAGSDDLPDGKTPLTVENVLSARWFAYPGRSGDLAVVERPGGPLRFSAALAAPGVVTVSVSFKAERTEIGPGEVESYLREINADSSVRTAWLNEPRRGRWQELRSRFAKTFVRVGEPTAGTGGWEEPVGGNLELVPRRDPTDLLEGDSLPLRVLSNGRPLAGIAVQFVAAGGNREHIEFTDERGWVTAVLDRAGIWLIQGITMTRSSGGGEPWVSCRAAMTVRAKSNSP